MFRRISDVVKEMVVGIFAVDLLIAVIGLIFVPQKISFLIGVLMGLIVAVIMVFSMNSSFEKAMDFGGKAAVAQCVKGYAFRTMFVFVGLIVACMIDLWTLAGFFFGVMGMKVAAYLQPHTKKLLHHE